MKDERCGVLDVSSRVCCWRLWGSEGVGERRGLGWVYQRGGVCGGLGQGTEVRFDMYNVLCITYVDSCYKAELDAKAYQHFLKKEEQRRRNEEEKKKLEEDLTLKETRNYANF